MPANVIEAAGTTERIASYLITTPSGFALTNTQLTGTINAVGVFDSVNLSPTIQFSRGVLITSGDGTPNRTNPSNAFTQSNGQAGNADLGLFATKAFAGSGTTQDATVLTLTFTVSNPDIKSLKFDVAFGSEEYPEYSSSNFVDIAAVWTGTGATARNYALINGNENAPLSVIDSNLSLGNFINNQSGGLAIEYDGLVNKQSIFVPVVQGTNVIKIGIADTGDSRLDSGLFIFGVQSSGTSLGGTFQNIQAAANGTYNAGTSNVIINGTPTQLANTTISNFSDLDQIFVNGFFFSDLNALLYPGSTIMTLDTDKNGSYETIITLNGSLVNGTLNVLSGSDGTAIIFAALAQATAGVDFLAGSNALDQISGGEGDDFLFGLDKGDLIDGEGGIDTIHYYQESTQGGGTRGTYVDLTLGFGQDTFGTYDYLRNIENATGTDLTWLDAGGGVLISDIFVGNGVANNFKGYGGLDYAEGRGGDDTLEMGDGNDIALGGDGNDVVYGGNGDDFIYGDDGSDYLYGEEGADWLFTGGFSGVNNGYDYAWGGNGNDVIAVGSVGGAGYLNGGAGNDVIYGGSGAAGSDTIVGGTGSDYMWGGIGGADTFRFDFGDLAFGDVDTIVGFQSGMVLSFDASYSGALTFSDGGGGTYITASAYGWLGFVSGVSAATAQAATIYG
jgi:Ca2+-binding RTX toxin-like protein